MVVDDQNLHRLLRVHITPPYVRAVSRTANSQAVPFPHSAGSRSRPARTRLGSRLHSRWMAVLKMQIPVKLIQIGQRLPWLDDVDHFNTLRSDSPTTHASSNLWKILSGTSSALSRA